jgi:hypothetical protein
MKKQKHREAKPRTAPLDDNDSERLARLIRAGVVRPGRGRLPKSFFTEKLPRLKDGSSVLAALLEERENGR